MTDRQPPLGQRAGRQQVAQAASTGQRRVRSQRTVSGADHTLPARRHPRHFPGRRSMPIAATPASVSRSSTAACIAAQGQRPSPAGWFRRCDDRRLRRRSGRRASGSRRRRSALSLQRHGLKQGGEGGEQRDNHPGAAPDQCARKLVGHSARRLQEPAAAAHSSFRSGSRPAAPAPWTGRRVGRQGPRRCRVPGAGRGSTSATRPPSGRSGSAKPASRLACTWKRSPGALARQRNSAVAVHYRCLRLWPRGRHGEALRVGIGAAAFGRRFERHRQK